MALPYSESYAGRDIKCEESDCDRTAFARGLCHMHYKRWWRTNPSGLHQYGPNCTVNGCSRPHKSKGFCDPHYKRWLRHGSTDKRRRSPGEGHLRHDGYKHYGAGRKHILEHRIVWEAEHGPIPPGMVIHHRDGNKLNNTIDNLEMMTNAEHMRHHAIERFRVKRGVA